MNVSRSLFSFRVSFGAHTLVGPMPKVAGLKATELACGTRYWWRVAANRSAVSRPWSDPAKKVTP
jgi:hypothetical protein